MFQWRYGIASDALEDCPWKLQSNNQEDKEEFENDPSRVT